MTTEVWPSPMTETLTFRLRSGGIGPRRFPHSVGSRTMPDTLLEVATGGGWRVQDLEAGIELTAPSGRVVVVPAERRHSMDMLPGRAMRSHWNMVALEDELGRDVLARFAHAFVLPAKPSGVVSKLMNKLAARRESDLAGRIAFQRLGLEIASVLLDHQPPSVALTRPIAERIEHLLQFIRRHLHLPLTRDSLARQMHLSSTRFHYVFVEAMGQSPMHYVTAQRIRRAQQLLISTAMSSKEIGLQCGFANATHFARRFAEWTSMSPLDYRRQLREDDSVQRKNRSSH